MAHAGHRRRKKIDFCYAAMAHQFEPKLPIFITILLRARIYYIGIMRSLRVGSLRMQFMSKSSVLNYLEDQPTDFPDLTVGKFLKRISIVEADSC